MGFETFAIVENGEVRAAAPGFADGTRVHVKVEREAPGDKVLAEMTDEERRSWLDGVWGGYPDAQEPPDLPAERIETW